MPRFLLVAQREYVANVRTKGFIVGILFFPFLITIAIAAPQLLERTKSARRYAVVDESGWLLSAVEQRVTGTDLGYVFQAVLEKHRDDAEAFAQLPPILQDLVPVLEQLQPGQEFVFARYIVSEVDGGLPVPGSARLPQVARAAAAERGVAILGWWRALPPSEAEDMTSRVSVKRYVRIDVSGSSAEQQAELNRRLQDGNLFAYFVIGPDPASGSQGSKYVSNNLTDEDLREWFSFNASQQVRARRLQSEEIDPVVAQWIQEPLRFEPLKLSETGEEEEIEERDTLRQWAPVAFVYLLWISVWVASNMLMMNTVEEKSTRIIEVLLSSVSPVQLLAGKIVGIAATGLTLVSSWLVFFFLGTKFIPRFLGAPPSFDLTALATDPTYILSFLAYFLLGYLLYAAILVGLGSVCNTVSDAQNMLPPVMLFLFIPLVSMVPIGKDPNGALAQVMSYIPPFTPFVMMNRAAGPPTTMEYVLTTALLIVSIVIALWAGAKIFRIGILLTGKPPKLKEILRWLRAPVGMVPVRSEGRQA
jgi:ABC-2 type transport system permease protein